MSSGSILIQETGYGCEVLEAPDEALVSLVMLQGADPRRIYVNWRTITFNGDNGSFVYDIVGWNYDAGALVLHRQEAS